MKILKKKLSLLGTLLLRFMFTAMLIILIILIFLFIVTVIVTVINYRQTEGNPFPIDPFIGVIVIISILFSVTSSYASSLEGDYKIKIREVISNFYILLIFSVVTLIAYSLYWTLSEYFLPDKYCEPLMFEVSSYLLLILILYFLLILFYLVFILLRKLIKNIQEEKEKEHFYFGMY